MIQSFNCKDTQSVFEGRHPRRFRSIELVAVRKLAMLDAARTLDFLRVIDAQRQVIELREQQQMAIVELHRRGCEHASVVAAVADGAPWCQSFSDDHLPGSIRILDYPHALEHLTTVAQAVFGQGTGATTAWLAQQRTELLAGDPERVLHAIATLPIQLAHDPAQAATIRDRELAYFTARRTQITYAQFVAAGLPIGSGAVESANKLVVEARLKRTA